MGTLITKPSVLASPGCFKLAILTAILSLGVSCATHSKPRPTAYFPVNTLSGNDLHRTERYLRQEYGRWKGTKHKMGGTDQRGLDCSGFVKTVYENVFNVDLPRTTKGQLRVGTPVNRYKLQAGDLVFFRPPGYPRHVGIYLSKNEFVHASKTNGVTISRIDRHYWGKYYWTARRINDHP